MYEIKNIERNNIFNMKDENHLSMIKYLKYIESKYIAIKKYIKDNFLCKDTINTKIEIKIQEQTNFFRTFVIDISNETFEFYEYNKTNANRKNLNENNIVLKFLLIEHWLEVKEILNNVLNEQKSISNILRNFKL